MGMNMDKEMIFSLLLASGVVLFGVALLNGSLAPMPQRKIEVKQNSTDRKYQPVQMNEREQDQEAAATIDNAETIIKCTIGGKVIYSDKPCPKNAKITQVEIHETSGIVTPSRDVVEKTMQKMADERRKDSQNLQTKVMEIGSLKHDDCDHYRKSIEELDAITRNALPWQIQEQIRADRTKLRDQQRAAHC
jgi:hypothetical protein